jgi:hypothetical protein
MERVELEMVSSPQVRIDRRIDVLEPHGARGAGDGVQPAGGAPWMDRRIDQPAGEALWMDR